MRKHSSAAEVGRDIPVGLRGTLRRRPVATAAIVAGVVLVSLGTWVMTQPAFAAVSRGTIPSVDRGHGRSIGLGGVTPTTLTIPAIGVHASVTPVDVEQGGELGVPTSFRAAGWWRSGPGLDRNGPLVLVGHVDDHSGPALFFRLRDLRPGDAVSVAGADGIARHYVIDAVRQYDKSAFPATLVYGATDRHTLRLITCGGYSFWRLHYKDNVVVFAHEVAA